MNRRLRQWTNGFPKATPSPRLSFRANFTWVATGNIAYALTQGGIMIVLARMTNPETVGRYALALAITSPVMLFAQLRLQDVLATDTNESFPFASYLKLTVIASGLALVVVWLVTTLLGYSGEAMSVIMVVAIAKAIELVSFIFYGLQQREERMDRIAASLTLRGILAFSGLTLGVLMTGRLIWGAAGMALAWATVLVLFDIPMGQRALGPKPAEERGRGLRLLKLVWMAAPLGVMQLLTTLNPSIPRLFLERMVGERDLGIFAAMAYLVIALSMPSRALGQAAGPQLAQRHIEGDQTGFQRLLRKLVLIAAVVGAGGILGAWALGKPALALLYGSEYSTESGTLILLMIYGTLLFVSMQLTQALIATRRLQELMFVSAMVVAVSAATSIIWIPRYGIVGAASVLIVAGAVRFIASSALIIGIARRPNRPRASANRGMVDHES